MTDAIRALFRAVADIPRPLRLVAFWLVGVGFVAVGTVHDIVTRPPSPGMFAGQVAVGAWRRGWGWDGSALHLAKFPVYLAVDFLAVDAAPSTRFVLAAIAVGVVTWALPTACVARWAKTGRLEPLTRRVVYAGLLILAATYGTVFRGARPDGVNIEASLVAIVVVGLAVVGGRHRIRRGRAMMAWFRDTPPDWWFRNALGICALYVAPLVVALAGASALNHTADDARAVQTAGWPLAEPAVVAILAAADDAGPAIVGTASARYADPITFLSGFAADAVPHLCVTAPDRLDLSISPADAARLAVRTAQTDDGDQSVEGGGNQTELTFIVIDQADQQTGCDEEIVTLQFGDDYAARYQISPTTWMFIYTRNILPLMSTVP